MEIVIRESVATDCSTIVDFQLAMALETEELVLDKNILSSGVKAVLDDNSKAKYFIATSEDKPVGMLMITPEWSDWRDGWVWWIQSVYTHPQYRKHGIYKLLYQHIKDLVNSSPRVWGIRLYVDKRNIAAQKVYTKLGMTQDHYSTFEWMKDCK